LEGAEAELGSNNDASGDWKADGEGTSPETSIEISADAKASLATALNADNNLAPNSHASAKLRCTFFCVQQATIQIAQ
jgi:hypothetical protein